jgi:hypothetical protein
MTRQTDSNFDPTSSVWAAAVAGLLGMIGCGDGGNEVEPDPTPVDAKTVDAPGIDAPPDAPPEPMSKITSMTDVTYTYAELTAMCDTKKGWINIHGACSGTNLCAGFSYLDSTPGELIEHTCNAVNSCAGASCLVGPADSGLTGQQVYENTVADEEGVATKSCTNCHGDWSGAVPDFSKFGVYVRAGDGRTLANWKTTRSVEVMQRLIAFGTIGVYAEGVGFSHMAMYGKKYSRAEITRVTDYVRGLPDAKIFFHTIKTSDTVSFAGNAPGRHPARRSH